MPWVVFENSEFFFSVICCIGSGTSQTNDSRKESYDQALTHLLSASFVLQTTIYLQVFLDISLLYTHYTLTRLFCTLEPANKHSNNAIVVKSGKDDIVGHVPETPAKKSLNFMKSQRIGIMDSEVTGDPRPAPKGRWVIGGGIEIPYKYRLYGSKSVKIEVRTALK